MTVGAVNTISGGREQHCETSVRMKIWLESCSNQIDMFSYFVICLYSGLGFVLVLSAAGYAGGPACTSQCKCGPRTSVGRALDLQSREFGK